MIANPAQSLSVNRRASSSSSTDCAPCSNGGERVPDKDVSAAELPSLFSSTQADKTYINSFTIWQHAGFNRGVSFITDKMMTTPANVERRVRHSIFRPDCEHPAQTIVHSLASGQFDGDTQTAGMWRKVMTTFAITHGNGVSYIERDRRTGRATELIPLPPHRTFLVFENLSRDKQLKLANGRIQKTQKWYCVYVGGQMIKIRPENVFHVRNGVTGCSHWSDGVVTFAARSAKVGVSATKFGGQFFDNGANVSGILMLPGNMQFESDQEKRDFAAKFNRAYSGLSAANKTLILEEGMKFLTTTIPNNAAQFLESRKFSNGEMALYLRLSMAITGGDAPYSYNTVEQIRLDARENAFEYWWNQFEGEYRLKVLTGEEQRGGDVQVRFDRDHGSALPFTDKVTGYTSLWTANLVDRATVKHKLGEEVCDADFIYADGTRSDCNICDEVELEDNEDVEVPEVETDPEALISARQNALDNLRSSVWRGMRRHYGDFARAVKARTMKGFVESINRRRVEFCETVKTAAALYAYLEKLDVDPTEFIAASCIEPLFDKAEKILDTFGPDAELRPSLADIAELEKESVNQLIDKVLGNAKE